jgi:hypothetical protein
VFTVTGRLPSGAPYDVTVGQKGDPHVAWGIVSGTSRVLALLAGLEGRQVEASPTGPYYQLAGTDAEAILAALIQHTTIDKLTGDVPDVGGDLPAGAIA